MTNDLRKLDALSAASSVYLWLDIIDRHRRLIAAALEHHDPATGDNATRRDCDAFHGRLRELVLVDAARREAALATGKKPALPE